MNIEPQIGAAEEGTVDRLKKKQKKEQGGGSEDYCRRPARDNEVYDYFMHDYVKSKQKTDSYTEGEWKAMEEARNNFLKIAKFDRIFE